jgi:hypothetical protein
MRRRTIHSFNASWLASARSSVVRNSTQKPAMVVYFLGLYFITKAYYLQSFDVLFPEIKIPVIFVVKAYFRGSGNFYLRSLKYYFQLKLTRCPVRFCLRIYSIIYQGCGSGSGSALICVAGSGSRRAKMNHKNRKKLKIFHVLECWMFSFEGWRLLL